MPEPTLAKLKALLFDVFGTTVDWRSSIDDTLKKHAKDALSDSSRDLPPGLRERVAATDWADFAEDWRSTYVKFTRQYPAPGSGDGKKPFKTVDQHYHESLLELLEKRGFHDLWAAGEVKAISRAWHYLKGWSDSPAGLTALNEQGLETCTLSNGNIALLEDMAKFAGLPWTHIFSSEHFGVYKPSREVYEGAVKKLGLQPEECAMVAAHLTDLWHARKYGLRTIYVEREQEEGWDADRVKKAKEDGWADVWISLTDGDDEKGGFLELSRIMKENRESAT